MCGGTYLSISWIVKRGKELIHTYMHIFVYIYNITSLTWKICVYMHEPTPEIFKYEHVLTHTPPDPMGHMLENKGMNIHVYLDVSAPPSRRGLR